MDVNIVAFIVQLVWMFVVAVGIVWRVERKIDQVAAALLAEWKADLADMEARLRADLQALSLQIQAVSLQIEVSETRLRSEIIASGECLRGEIRSVADRVETFGEPGRPLRATQAPEAPVA